MPTHQELTGIAVVVAAALLCGMALTRLRQPAVVGYIIAGILLGPSGLAVVEDRAQVNFLAELGVLLLLFLIGMELRFEAFKAIYRIAVFGTLLQIAISLGVTLLLSQLLGWPIGQAVLLGFVVSLSSTAVAIKVLEDIDELTSEVGRRAVGVLIAQDLAVVPMILVLNAMAAESRFAAGTLLPIAAGLGFLALIVWYLSRHPDIHLPFRSWAKGRRELTPLAALAYCFVAAAVSGVLGLSAAYGAFLAGLFIGNSTDRRAMIRVTQPIQSVLLMVFFLSIGLLIDIRYIGEHLGSVLVLLLIVTVGKTAMNVGVLRLLGEPWPRAFLIAVVLGQVGEFSFVLAAVGLSNGLIVAEGHRLAVAVIALSLMISPLWLDAARRLNNLATTGVEPLKEVLDMLYGGEATAIQERAGGAVVRLRELAAGLAEIGRRALDRLRSGTPAARANPNPQDADADDESRGPRPRP
ncbi:MAG: cation:proton antiporter [Alphaproteobacteria bacterium]